jgi:hypothetical protein
MEQGIKVDGGDRLGKIIIFARSHNHAIAIENRFNQNYPHYQGAFARIIDNYDKYAQSTLDDFSDPAKQPTIAISVDMLDTGVDVPQIVNLMFFKTIYSRVKFNQMIGRGTRLCPDLFGVGLDKQELLKPLPIPIFKTNWASLPKRLFPTTPPASALPNTARKWKPIFVPIKTMWRSPNSVVTYHSPLQISPP